MTDTQNNLLRDVANTGRVLNLQSTAYTLRQHAINAGRDLEGWRLARRMRDVASPNQIDALEHELTRYLHSRRVRLASVA
ncbi:MAG: hypothetical protein JWQ94_511 [Tardiphaga sp.]|jgi:hypothetical protein|nr:hypothetical protein [Tardiphaga sp.]